MIAQVSKEFRATLMYFLVALGVSAAVAFSMAPMQMDQSETQATFAILIAFAAASLFGYETENGMWPILLAQPVNRRRLWAVKMLVLGLELAALTAVFVSILVLTRFDFRPVSLFREGEWLVALALCALGLTPWLTLLLRNGLAAASVVAVVLGGAAEMNDTATWDLGICFVVGGAAGFMIFERWQPGTARRFEFFWRPWRAAAVVAAGSSRQGSLIALLRKELALQVFSLTAMAAFALVIFIEADDGGLRFLYFLIFPACVGAVALARERELRVLEWHLTLPVSVARQWSVKLAAVYAIVIAGAGLPRLMGWLHVHAGLAFHPMGRAPAGLLIVLVVGTTAVLGASQSRTLVRAAVIGVAAEFGAIGAYNQWLSKASWLSSFMGSVYSANPAWCNRYTTGALGVAAVLWTLRQAGHHFRYGDVAASGWLAVRIAALYLAAILISMLIYVSPSGFR